MPNHLRASRRTIQGVQFRATDQSKGQFVARVMHYDVVDDYGTIFAPSVFTASLERRMPRVVWAHNWSEPLGRYVDYEDTATHLDLVGEFDDFEDVPRARQAYAQLKSGTIDEFSVGFMPEAGEEVMIDERYYFKFTRARLDEASLVLAGAVPNTELLDVRSKGLLVRSPIKVVSKDEAAQIILDLHHGDIDLADALQKVKMAEEPAPEEPPAEEPPVEEPPVEVEVEDPPVEETEEPPVEETEDPPIEDVMEDPPAREVDWSEFDDVDNILGELTSWP